MTKPGRFHWAVWLGWEVTTAGTGLLILLDAQLWTYAWILMFIVVGLGHGFILMFSIRAILDTHNVAYAAAMYTFTRTFSMYIGSAVFQNQLKKHLANLELLITVATGFNATTPKASLLDSKLSLKAH